MRAGAARRILVVGAVVVGVTTGCSEAPPRVASAPAKQQALLEGNELRDLLDRAVDLTRDTRRLDTKTQAAWQVVHGIMVYGPDFLVYHDKKLVPAVDYLLQGGKLTGWNMRKGDHGVEALLEAGSKTGQGHEDQWLGYLSQSGISLDQPLSVEGQTYKVGDLLRQAQWDIYDGMEATWTLMALTAYLPADTTWKAKDGSTWNVERVVDMEASQDLNESACGGSHRLYGLAFALKRHREQGGKLTGGWKKAQDKINFAASQAKQFQQPDGSFSINFFERSASSPDIEKRINTTGHTLEFLAVALDDKQIKEPWVKRAAINLASMIERTKDFGLECGSLYHAVHALALYRERVFGPRPSAPTEPPSSTAQRAPEPQGSL